MINSLGFLGQKVNVVIDRPLGSKHPKADGEEQDVYVLGIDKPVNKLVVTPDGKDFSDEEISKAWPTSLVEKLIEFQEKYFKHVILRKSL